MINRIWGKILCFFNRHKVDNNGWLERDDWDGVAVTITQFTFCERCCKKIER